MCLFSSTCFLSSLFISFSLHLPDTQLLRLILKIFVFSLFFFQFFFFLSFLEFFISFIILFFSSVLVFFIPRTFLFSEHSLLYHSIFTQKNSIFSYISEVIIFRIFIFFLDFSSLLCSFPLTLKNCLKYLSGP